MPIVFLTGHYDIATNVQSIKAGAEDFLTKPVAKEQLLAVTRRAIARCDELCRPDDWSPALRSLVARLTPREHDVFALLVRGKPHKQIARPGMAMA